MNVPEICAELQALQKQRAWHMKSRIMIANRLQASVAETLGYHSGMKELERGKKMAEADKLIKEIAAGRNEPTVTSLVVATLPGINAFKAMQKQLEKEMVKWAEQLPVAAWVEQPEQRGFGMLGLAIVVGECGDLSNYANPGKVWRRMGCAPFTKDGETLMGATWRSRKNGKVRLHAEDWERFGYSPRRRAVSFNIGEPLIKLNFMNGAGDGCHGTDRRSAGEGAVEADRVCAGDSGIETETMAAGENVSETEIRRAFPYRNRYDVKKAEAAVKHPEWICCPKCEGTGAKAGKKCANCKGSGEVWMHCHRHGMLLATKLLLKNLRIAWGPMESKAWIGDVGSGTELHGADHFTTNETEMTTNQTQRGPSDLLPVTRGRGWDGIDGRAEARHRRGIESSTLSPATGTADVAELQKREREVMPK